MNTGFSVQSMTVEEEQLELTELGRQKGCDVNFTEVDTSDECIAECIEVHTGFLHIHGCTEGRLKQDIVCQSRARVLIFDIG